MKPLKSTGRIRSIKNKENNENKENKGKKENPLILILLVELPIKILLSPLLFRTRA